MCTNNLNFVIHHAYILELHYQSQLGSSFILTDPDDSIKSALTPILQAHLLPDQGRGYKSGEEIGSLTPFHNSSHRRPLLKP